MMNGEQKYEIAMQSLLGLLNDREPSEVPEALASDPLFMQMDGAVRTIRAQVSALNRGDLKRDVEGKGFVIGALKALQSAMRHLVWQSREIAAGDFEQKVEFLGEFSEAFNEMAGALGERTELLRRSEAKYRMLFENAAESIAVVSGGQVVLANPIFEKMTGGAPGPKRFWDIFIKQDREVALSLCEALLDGRPQENQVTLRVETPEGVVWLEAKGVPIDWYGQKALIFFLVDVTKRKRAESALYVSEEKYRLMAEHAQDVIWVLDLTSGCFTYMSPSVYSLRGITAEEALREYIADSMPEESYARFNAYLSERIREFEESAASVKNDVIEVEQHKKDGSIVSTEVSIKLRLNVYGGLEAVGISRDITKRKLSEREILYLNQHDPLTDLHNRRFYSEQLELLNAKDDMPLSMVLIDVNGMKLMNDAFGHMVGDQLLVSFAQVLRTSLRTSDIAARIGGDEFVLLLPRTNFEAAERIVQRIKSAIATKSVQEVTISASFGIATKLLVEEDVADVYRVAEDNMYREKLLASRQLKADLLRQILANLYKKSDVERRHSEAVSRLCMAIGREMRMDYEEVEKLGAVGLYHDIGKVALDEGLINKPGELDSEEMTELSKHPEISYQILRSFSGMGEIAESVLMHHRRVDGAGYPEVSAPELPLQAKILSVAEAYDMMTGPYPFRPALSEAQAIEELRANADSQFDGEIVRVFIERVLQGNGETRPSPRADQNEIS
jgi:diguanylate cyclase (GGDEF)-like protein/PAS domain S-box-containing protein